MKSLEHLTLSNLLWLRDICIPTSKLRITQEHLNIVLRGKALVLNQEMEHLGCYSCSARSYFSVSKSVLEQYEQAVLNRIQFIESQGQAQDAYNVGNFTEKTEDTQVGQEEETVTSITQESPENDKVLDGTVGKVQRKKNKTTHE